MKYSLRSLMPNRRWFQFSLRLLFVVITVAALWTGWTTWRLRMLEAQWPALEKLKRADKGQLPIVSFETEPATVLGFSFPHALHSKWDIVRSLDLNIQQEGPASAPELSHLRHLARLKLRVPPLTEVDLTPLYDLAELKELSIESECVTGEFLVGGTLRQTLERLEISPYGLTNAGAQRIGECLNLRKLRVIGFRRRGSDVIDWSFLGRLPHLEELEVSHCASNSMWEHLAKSSSMRKVTISADEIPEAAVIEIAQSKSIEDLSFICPKMSDSTLHALKSMRQLNRCEITCALSDEAFAELQRTHPRWKVIFPMICYQ